MAASLLAKIIVIAKEKNINIDELDNSKKTVLKLFDKSARRSEWRSFLYCELASLTNDDSSSQRIQNILDNNKLGELQDRENIVTKGFFG